MASKDVKVTEPRALSHSPETENNNVIKVEEKDNIGGDQGRNIMMILRRNLFAIKRVMEDYWLRFACGGNLERTMTYQVWPGKNVHCICFYSTVNCYNWNFLPVYPN